jgi:hypothetical protein
VDSYFLRYNERIKGISGVLNNLGAALLAVSVGRMSLNEADLVALLWFLGSCVLLFGGWAVLGLLEEA